MISESSCYPLRPRNRISIRSLYGIIFMVFFYPFYLTALSPLKVSQWDGYMLSRGAFILKNARYCALPIPIAVQPVTYHSTAPCAWSNIGYICHRTCPQATFRAYRNSFVPWSLWQCSLTGRKTDWFCLVSDGLFSIHGKMVVLNDAHKCQGNVFSLSPRVFRSVNIRSFSFFSKIQIIFQFLVSTQPMIEIGEGSKGAAARYKCYIRISADVFVDGYISTNMVSVLCLKRTINVP